MPIFQYSFTVAATQDAVSAFHHHTSALKTLSPPPMFVQLHKIEPLAEGSTSKFTLWLGPLPIRWTAVHSNVTAAGFTDTQTEGPAQKWVHTHTFQPLSKTETEVQEYIDYEHGRGFWGVMTRLLFAKPGLYLMFTYRMLRTRWALRKSS